MFRATEPVYEGDLVVTDGIAIPSRDHRRPRIDETADSEVGFVLRTEVDPAANLSQVDYVKVIIVGFSTHRPGD